MYRWRFSGRTPERLQLTPPDLRLADPAIAHEIYSGRFPFSGHIVDTGGLSPFQVSVTNRSWLKALHGFRWLRHLRAAGTDLASANARALVNDWLAEHASTIDGVAWEPGTVAKRMIAWLQHSNTVLQGAELEFYRSFLRSLAVQVRYLRATASEMPPGKEKMRVRAALAYAALSLPSSASALRSSSRNLETEIAVQILPDGGHVSRNPLTLLDLLADFLPLRQIYANQGAAAPESLINAIDRMLPALRFFRHSDGSLARFNGMGMTIHERVGAVLRHDDTSGAPLLHAPHSGYDRLALGQTVVIADTGAPPVSILSNSAHAGCLSFELSSARHCFIVNCGVDSYGPADLRSLARATAAHSTATLNDSSQARFSHSRRVHSLLGTPLFGGPLHVACQRIDEGGMQGFVASHDAYVRRFGIGHERQLRLEDDGGLLNGIDRFYHIKGREFLPDGRDLATVRFHIHPDVEVRADRGEILLSARSGECWLFACPDAVAEVEGSIFFASSGGPRRAQQIALNIRLSQTSAVRWRFRRET
jgi:uncharacterized heparinase superfamily protein